MSSILNSVDYQKLFERSVRTRNTLQICIAEQAALQKDIENFSAIRELRGGRFLPSASAFRDAQVRLASLLQMRKDAESHLAAIDRQMKLLQFGLGCEEYEKIPQPIQHSSSSEDAKIKRTNERTIGIVPNSADMKTTSVGARPRVLVKNFASYKSFAEPQVDMLVKQNQFFDFFGKDVQAAQTSIEIMCPFVHPSRFGLLNTLGKLPKNGGTVVLYTRPQEEPEKKQFLARAEELGIVIEQRRRMHEKLVIIDGQIVWEGSLNVLAHCTSTDFMRRLIGAKYANQHRQLHELKPLDLARGTA